MNRLEAGEAEKAAEFVPEDLLYTVQLGRGLLARQKFEEAAVQFKKVLLAMPESPNSASWLDEAWAEVKNPEGRRQDWQSIVDAHLGAVIPREQECLPHA